MSFFVVNTASMYLLTSANIIKTTFINFLYGPLSPYIADREAVQNQAVLE